MKTFKQYITERMMGHGHSEYHGHYAHPMDLHLKKGAFHRWLGKSEDEPITAADIEKGLKAGGHAAKMANFAKNAKHFHHGK